MFLAQLKPSDAQEVVEGLERPGSCINLVSLRPTVCSDVTVNGLAAAAALTYHGKQMKWNDSSALKTMECVLLAAPLVTFLVKVLEDSGLLIIPPLFPFCAF